MCLLGIIYKSHKYKGEEDLIMKKRLLAVICSLALVAGMPLTASAAAPSPAVANFIAANIDLDFEVENADIKVADISKVDYEMKEVSNVAKVAFLECVQESDIYKKANDKNAFRFLNAFKATAKKAGTYTVKFDASKITNADAANIWAYDPATNAWTKVNTSTLNGAIYAELDSKYTYVIFTVDGVVPTTERLSVVETSKADLAKIVGGKGEGYTVVFNSDALAAPSTGETTVLYFAFAACAFAALALVSGKKLFA